MGVWMAGQSNAAPVIIKRKKNIVSGGHHGGAWKVAYADFVTAMMAFFLLMWLLNATTEKQRKGLADYFSPAVPISRTSGGGDGAFGGESILSEQSLLRNGTGASAQYPTEDRQASGAALEAADSGQKEELLAEVEKQLRSKSGESATMRMLLEHVVTRITDEGLVIEVFDLPGLPLFQAETDKPNKVLNDLVSVLSDVLHNTVNPLAVNGHTRSYPVVIIENPTWNLSASRAQVLRLLMEAAGTPSNRFLRVTGHADRSPAAVDPTSERNNRLELILLRLDL